MQTPTLSQRHRMPVEDIARTVGALMHPAFLHFAPIFSQGYVKTCYK